MKVLSTLFRYYVAGSLLIILLFAGGWVLWGRINLFHSSAEVKLYRSNNLMLSHDAQVHQSFLSRYPGLFQIDVLLNKSATSERDESEEIILHVRESCGASQDLRTVVRSVIRADLPGEAFYSFVFRPIEDSDNRRYCFVLESDNPQGFIAVGASHTDVYENGEAIYVPPPPSEPLAQASPRPLPAATSRYIVFLPLVASHAGGAVVGEDIDVGFQLYYDSQPWATVEVFFGHLVAYKPYFFGTPAFYVGLIMTYLAGLLLLLDKVFTESRDIGQKE